MLGIYNSTAKLFVPLFETVNKQPDEQPDTTDMPELESLDQEIYNHLINTIKKMKQSL